MAAVVPDERAGVPTQAGGEPAGEQQGGRRRLGVVTDLQPRDRLQVAAAVGGIEGGGDPLTPGRRAQPREVDHVDAVGQAQRMPHRRGGIGLLHRVHEDDLAQVDQLLERVVVSVGRPDERRQVGLDERVDDRVESVEVVLAEAEDDRLANRRELTLLDLGGAAERDDGVDLGPVRLDRADDGARRVEPAHLPQPVRDLPAPVVVDDQHQVEHPRVHVARVLLDALVFEVPDRGFHGGRARVALTPDGVGGGGHRAVRPVASGRRPAGGRRPRPGPACPRRTAAARHRRPPSGRRSGP